MDNFDPAALIAAARAARSHAYAPYSHYTVGAALMCQNGAIYTGCNVEGASFGNAICAERVALVKAMSDGHRDFAALAVIAGGADFCTPCGICRQMLYEFAEDMPVFCCNQAGEYQQYNLRDLLPAGFSGRALDV
jgi:cytidine deaminase